MSKYIFSLLSLFVIVGSPLLSKAATVTSGGYLDAFEHSATVAEFEVRGWAYNPDHPDHAVVIDVYMDGRRINSLTPQATRSDVIAFTGVTNVYGFVYDLPTNAFTCSGSCPTTHEVQFISRDLTTGETFVLGNGVQSVNHDDVGVIGSVDRVSLENAQNPEIFVRGWATTDSGLPLDVYVMVDGQLAGHDSTDVARTDVNSVYNLGSGYVGYAIPVADNRESSSDTGMGILVYTFNGNTNTFTLIGADYYLFED